MEQCEEAGVKGQEEVRIGAVRCTKIMDRVIRDVGPDVWNSIEDCRFIYPMVKRVADGSLRTQDIVKEILKGG